MSMRYLIRVIDDIDYHVNDNYDYTSLLKINDDIEKAKQEILRLEQMIYNQIQHAVQVVRYREIVVRRYKPYQGNIELTVFINEYMSIYGERLPKNETVYATHKKFKGNEKKKAIAYANELRTTYHHPIVYDNWR